jgi:multicomponent Na+:H+ antiporter subunit G
MMLDIVSIALVAVGLIFFTAGTMGLLRFPDVHSRLHALTKADNLGLGFIVIGAALQGGGVGTLLKLLHVWLLTMIAAATVAQLVASSARDSEADR